MRRISAKDIQKAVAELCIKANTELRADVLAALKSAYKKERDPQARDVLAAIVKNAELARRENLAICQDTGMPCVFVELGNEVIIAGDLKQAVNKGVEEGYRRGYLRSSVISNPLLRQKPGFNPSIIHLEIIKGRNLKLTVLPKGFGCENKSALKMFIPTADIDQIKQFIIESVKKAGPDACPPYILGIGIGGTADYAAFLAKKALLKKVTSYPSTTLASVPSAKTASTSARGGISMLQVTSYESKLERDLLIGINKLNIGPMGLGGSITCLGVNILTYPTHIAGLPVAINFSCHALRSASKVL